MMRLEAGRDPLNKQLTALIGELSTLSPHQRPIAEVIDGGQTVGPAGR
jgi:hypothetical protein